LQHRRRPIYSVYADIKSVCFGKPLYRRYICQEQVRSGAQPANRNRIPKKWDGIHAQTKQNSREKIETEFFT